MLSLEARNIIAANPHVDDAINAAFDKVKQLPRIQQETPNRWRYADWTFTRRDSGVVLGNEHEQALLPLLVTQDRRWWYRMAVFVRSEHMSSIQRALYEPLMTPAQTPLLISDHNRIRLHIEHVYGSAIANNHLACTQFSNGSHKPGKSFLKETGHWLWYQLLNPDVARYTVSIFGHRASIANYNTLVSQYDKFKALPANLMRFWSRLLMNPLLLPAVAWRIPNADDLRQDLIEVGNLKTDQLTFLEQLGPASAQYLSLSMRDPNTVSTADSTPNRYHAWGSMPRNSYDPVLEIQGRGAAIETLTDYFVDTKRIPRYSTVRLISRLSRVNTPTELCHQILRRVDQQLDTHPRTNLTAVTARFGKVTQDLIQAIGPADTSLLMSSIETNDLNEYLDQAQTAVDLYDLKGRPATVDTFPF